MRAELPHDVRWQVAAGLAPLGLDGDITEVNGEVLAQAGGRTARAGQPYRPGACEHVPDLAAGPDPGVTGDLPG